MADDKHSEGGADHTGLYIIAGIVIVGITILNNSTTFSILTPYPIS